MNDENEKGASHALTMVDPEPESTEGPDHDLRYKEDPVEALKVCRDRFQENEERYRKTRYRLVATIYAIALRLLADDEAQDRFFAQSYFQKAWRRHVQTPRDLFESLRLA